MHYFVLALFAIIFTSTFYYGDRSSFASGRYKSNLIQTDTKGSVTKISRDIRFNQDGEYSGSIFLDENGINDTAIFHVKGEIYGHNGYDYKFKSCVEPYDLPKISNLDESERYRRIVSISNEYRNEKFEMIYSDQDVKFISAYGDLYVLYKKEDRRYDQYGSKESSAEENAVF